MKRRTLLALGLIGASCAALAGFVMWPREPKEPTELVLYGNVDVRLVYIGFRVSGLVNELFFRRGRFRAGRLSDGYFGPHPLQS